MTKLIDHIAEILNSRGILCRKQEPLANHTSFRIGGPCALAVFPSSAEELITADQLLRENGIPVILLGNGSNVLADSAGTDAAILFTTFMTRTMSDGARLTADCGLSYTSLSNMAQKMGLEGLAFAYGIPGTVGGAVYMNAGAYEGDTASVLESAFCYDPKTGSTCRRSRDELQMDYRRSKLMESGEIVLSADFRLREGNADAIRALMDEHMAARREKQPLDYPSAGSTFKRYPGYYTAKLIDECGLKGASVGGAMVSTKHAGFVINTGNATSDDVLALIDRITNEIDRTVGITVEREIRILTKDGRLI